MSREYRFRLVAWAVGFCVVMTAFLFVRQFLRQQKVFYDLKQICAALHQYHERWDTLPPREWKNDLGTPLSYRVLLMSHFETEEAKLVVIEAQKAKSVTELESSKAFQKWRNTVEGQRFLNSSIEFVPVVGEWVSWGKPLTQVSKQEWKGWLVPIVVAVDVDQRPNWCEPSSTATANDKTLTIRTGHRTGKTLYSSCDCTIREVDLLDQR